MYLLVGKLAGTVDGLHGTRVAPPKLTHLSGYVLYKIVIFRYLLVLLVLPQYETVILLNFGKVPTLRILVVINIFIR